MISATTNLLQSKFFTPAFNTAIFDGPMRVYFAQHQETDALKMYFQLQNVFGRLRFAKSKIGFEEESEETALFVMIYPNADTYKLSFDSKADVCVEKLGSSYVLGVRGPLRDDVCEDLLSRVKEILKTWPMEMPPEEVSI